MHTTDNEVDLIQLFLCRLANIVINTENGLASPTSTNMATSLCIVANTSKGDKYFFNV